jgi:hypothetical protein
MEELSCTRSRWKNAILLVTILILANFGCNRDKGELSNEEITAKVASAYFHFFPIVENYKAIYAFRILKTSPKYVPMNQLTQESKLYTPADKFVVSPNNDTYYTTANLDLRAEPMVLKVPEVKDRYYSFQFVSMTTDNFAYIGTNTTGTESGEYVITGPDHEGELPDGLKEIKSPSSIIGFIGRTQVNVSDSLDVIKAKEVQAQYELSKLSEVYPEFEPKQVEEIDFPEYSAEAMQDQRFFEMLNFLLQFIELTEDEQRILDSYQNIGIAAGQEYRFFEENKNHQEAILKGIKKGIEKINSESKNLGTVKNGWTMYPLGEYFGTNYADRTKVAKMGIYANTPFEAFYPIAFVDSAGETLKGTNNYKVTFAEGNLPPAKYFWSLTMYDGETQLLVENELERYSIGDRTETLKYNADGALTIYIGNEPPSKGTGNWLPAPEGEFNVMMRIYGPKSNVLDGSWEPPSIIKVENNQY